MKLKDSSSNSAQNSDFSVKETERAVVNEFFRPIHYLGSKLRILDFIENIVNDVDPTGGRICDLFAGSGCVSQKFSKQRAVTAVDIQEYSRVLCAAQLNIINNNIDIDFFMKRYVQTQHADLLEWSTGPLIEYEKKCREKEKLGSAEPLCELIEKGSIIGWQMGYRKKCTPHLARALNETIKRMESRGLNMSNASLTIRHFGGLFFSYSQSVKIDALLQGVSKLDPDVKDIFLAAVLSTTSDIVNTVGKQFAQPIKPRNADGSPKAYLGKMMEKDRDLDVYATFQSWINLYLKNNHGQYKHHVLKMDYAKALESLTKDTRVIYADPPYTRDHYSRFYHVLETLSLRDNPQVSTVTTHGETNISRGIYRMDRHQSPFCIKSKAPNAFQKLFLGARNLDANLLISYSPYSDESHSHPRLLTIEELKKMARHYYNHVEVLSPGEFRHSKLNHSSKSLISSKNAEVLIVCRP